MKIVPVIHYVDRSQVMYNVDLCYNNGIDFVFLINHRIHDDSINDLKESFYDIKDKYPSMSVGINFLQLDTVDAFKEINSMINPKVDALWADKSYITNNTYLDGSSDLDKAQEILNNQKLGLYFGSIAFKYQRQPQPWELEWVCKTACEYMDVITTSGPGTGKAADIEKIKTIRSYIGTHQLAIASGLSSSNKSQFDPYVDYGLVASSITERITELISEKKLIELINS